MCCLYLVAQVGKANDLRSVHAILLVQDMENGMRMKHLNDRTALVDAAGS